MKYRFSGYYSRYFLTFFYFCGTVYTKQYMNCDNDGNPIERTQRPMGIIDEYSSTQIRNQIMATNYYIVFIF